MIELRIRLDAYQGHVLKNVFSRLLPGTGSVTTSIRAGKHAKLSNVWKGGLLCRAALELWQALPSCLSQVCPLWKTVKPRKPRSGETCAGRG